MNSQYENSSPESLPKLLPQLLEELYAVDPNLKTREKELTEIIIVLLKSKPNITLDENFKERLRMELRKHTDKPTLAFPSRVLGEINKMRKFNFAFGTALFLVLIVGAVTLQKNKITQPQLVSTDSGKIVRLADNAFGTLSNVSASADSRTGLGSAPASPTLQSNQPVGMPENMSLAVPPSGGGLSSGDKADQSDIRLYQPTYYRYIYNGEAVVIPKDKLEVLRKVKNTSSTEPLGNILRNTDLGVINFKAFGDLSLDNFSVSEKNGYIINVNAKDGHISIYEAYNPMSCGYGAPCAMPMEEQRITMPEVPNDEALITAANQFVQNHGINLSKYGQPKVADDWRIRYLATSDKSSFWIPDSGTVIYPAKINSIGIFDESGNEYGLTVNVRFSDKKVTSLNELTFPNYESSLYATETDIKRIMSLVNKGGMNGYYPVDEPIKTKDIELGTPSIQLMRHWNYQNNESSELYVPALVFPILNPEKYPDNYRKSVVVPIIKDILDAQSDQVRILKEAIPFPLPSISR